MDKTGICMLWCGVSDQVAGVELIWVEIDGEDNLIEYYGMYTVPNPKK